MLSQMVEEYQVDGVVDVILQACHTYAVESLAIKRHVRQQHNIPYIAIETDYSTSDVGRDYAPFPRSNTLSPGNSNY